MGKRQREEDPALPAMTSVGTAAPMVVGALSALGSIGKSLENIAQLNYETKKLEVDVARVKAQGRVMERKIAAALAVALSLMEERKLNLIAQARALRESFKPERISLREAVKATEIYGKKVAETRPDDPVFPYLVETHKLFYGLISQEASKYADRVERVIGSFQTQISSLQVPRLDSRSSLVGGVDE